MTIFTNALKRTSALTSALLLMTGTAMADQVFADDLIVQGSACIGIDCSNGESFGFDTIRLKENNLRIKAQDTSASASFPTVDWQITFNDSSNGGANKFSVDDIDNNRTPFTIEAGSINNALYVDSSGDIGVGTSTPVVEVHAVDGNSPTFRLEQDGSSGFTPQTWDLAGNETNFFLRDVTNGSKLPLRVQPNTPDQTMFMRTTGLTINETGANYDLRVESDTLTNALFMDGGTGNIGMGTDVPSSKLHITGADGAAFVENTTASTGARTVLQLKNNGRPDIVMANSGTSREWSVGGGTNFIMKAGALGSTDAAKTKHFDLNGTTGNLVITGTITTSGSCAGGCDLVFEDDYDLMSIEERAELMFANKYLPNVGATPENGPFNLSEKVGGILNELEHAHIYIAQLNERIATLEEMVSEQ
ncbi:hypothetical protein [uncultured Tateyamaria sp.]|uniref:hypothetical protein n=1 Tax=uncultured Tateyamaria sp. TaxID=455651 RepID=UPI0026298ED5|nr:hypothetical protein [uncultured Tateyamaria sp.]